MKTRYALMTKEAWPPVHKQPVEIIWTDDGLEYVRGWGVYEGLIKSGATFIELVIKEESKLQEKRDV